MQYCIIIKGKRRIIHAAMSEAERASYEESMELLTAAISCIAYIRNFFPDEVFVDTKIQGMNFKAIRGGINPRADKLLSWIKDGCGDAIKRKYLETMTLGISNNSQKSSNIEESYKFTFTYPDSQIHQTVQRMREGMNVTSVEMKTAEGSKLIKSDGKGTFGMQLATIIRALCVMVQTLKELPDDKVLSMRMTYYDELTPASYEPPGFSPCVFDLNYIFEGKTHVHDFGVVSSAYHGIQVQLETLDVYQQRREHRPEVLPAQVPKKENDSQELPPSITQAIGKPNHDDDPAIGDRVPDIVRPKKNPNEKNSCLCGDTESDLDMICCDECKTWQHTPCAGYCTNKDKRIPPKYICYQCEYKGNSKLLRALQDLAAFRRAISIVFSEGLESIKWLSRRMDCGVAKASKLVRRLENEGFIVRPDSQVRSQGQYVVQKTLQAKDRIRYFFGDDLKGFPELKVYFKEKTPLVPVKKELPQKPMTPSKRRKSMTSEIIACK